MNEYAFDVKLSAAIRVRAETEEQARDILQKLQGMDCNGGEWPDGRPILFEASVDDVNPYLYEVNGEPTA